MSNLYQTFMAGTLIPSMQKLKYYVLLLGILLLSVTSKAQLVVNEISQGVSSSHEYIELLVKGDRTCSDSTADIRKWIVDDNNGWLGTGSAQGIAAGCLRFADDANWAAVPYGSLILMYDDNSKNPMITMADDPTDANGDHVYVVPVSSLLIEKNTSTPTPPSNVGYVYPSTGFTAGGDWSLIGMANSGDGIILTAPAAPGTAAFSVAYGGVNNGSNATVYIPAGAGTLYYLNDDQFGSSASWFAGNAPTDETPGIGNSPSNSAWINAMRQSPAASNGPFYVSACITAGNSYNFNGNMLTTPGTYTDTFTTLKGCDSIVVLDLSVINTVFRSGSINGCNSILFHGITYITTTVIQDSMRSVGGCDSIITITYLIINHVVPVTRTTKLRGCDSVVFNGITYTASTTIIDTVKAAGGCDSIYNVTDIAIITPTNQTVTLRGCGSVVLHGITYTSPAVVQDTIKSVLGCDSLYRTVNIAIQNMVAVPQTTSFTACRSVVYNGVTYTSTSVVKDTLKSIYGCDSVYRTTTIKIQDIAPLIQTIFLADCDSVRYNNVLYTSSVAMKDTVRSSFGCDSIIKNVNIRIAPRPVKDSSTLRGCSSVTFNGVVYNDSTIVRDTVKNMMGCDSIYKVTNIIVRNLTPISRTDTLVGCNSLTFNGITYTTSAIVADTIRTAELCDSIYRTTNIQIDSITPITIDTTITGCKMVVYDSVTYNASTTVNQTIKTRLGCDSIYKVAHIIIRNITPVINTDSLVDCNKVIYNGVTYTTSTTVTDTVRTAEGCDTIYNVKKIVIKITPITQNTNFTSCSNVFYNGHNYTSSVVIRDTVKNVQGCDSVYKVTNINIQNTQVTQTNTLNGCNSLVYNGVTYTSSTVLKDTIRTSQYCDSIYTITNINIKKITPTNGTNTVKGCNSVVFNGVTYTASTIVLDTVRTAEGCDSIFRTNTITVTTVTPTVKSTALNGCLSLVFNGHTYTSDALVTDTIKSALGCDSVYKVTNIHVVTPVTQINNVLGCNGSVLFNGITYTSSTVVKDTLKSFIGCDSVYRTNKITVQNITPVTRNTNLSGCGSVIYNGVTYTSATVITDTVKSIAGCDSIYNKVFISIVITPTTISNTINGCGSVTFQGVTYTSSVVKIDTLRTRGGCDSVYKITNINVQNITPDVRNLTFRGCSGSVVFNGTTYTASTVMTDTTRSTIGCDSVYTINNIIVQNITPVSSTNTLSGCGLVYYNGIGYTSSTVVRDTIRTTKGCDSLYAITNINVVVPVTAAQDVNGCGSVTYKGITYTASAVIADTVRTAMGCDSIYKVVNINVQNITPTNVSYSFAGCNSLVLNGTTYTNSTVVLDTLRSMYGCDSIYSTTNILIQHITATTVNVRLEGCGSYIYNGVTYTSSATIRDTTKSIGGCDSIYTVTDIIVVKPTTENNSVFGCNSAVYNGVTYTMSTIVNDTVRTAKGCDSLYKVTTITIQNITPSAVNSQIAGCNSVLFNGVTYTQNAVVIDTIKSTAGCDSVYKTTNIIVQHITPVSTTQTLEGCSSLLYNGVTYTSSATIKDTVKSIGGCDSIYNTVYLNVIKAVIVNQTLKGCNSLVFNGTLYTTTTTVMDTLRTRRGCDSLCTITTIVIQNINPLSVVRELKGCSSLSFNGITYTSNAVVLDTLRSRFGCDSIYRTNNIYIQSITPQVKTENLTGCDLVIFNDKGYTASTVVKDTVKSSYGCDSIYNITNITVNKLKLSISANPNPAIRGASATMQTSGSTAYTVLAWTPAYLFRDQTQKTQTFIADSATHFSVIGRSAEGCLDTAHYILEVRYLDNVFIPNTFTPNSDGKNDEFKVYGNNIQQVDLRIFNQWGQQIFESKDQNRGWNGTVNGQLQPIGVYMYTVRIYMNDGTVTNKKGSLNLVR